MTIRICELTSLSPSGARKGQRQDKRTKQSIVQREKKRRDNEAAEEFTKTLTDMYPEYFGDKE